jgi:hypothetical protein
VKKATWVIITALALLFGVAAHVVGFFIAALGIGILYAVICRLAPRTRHTGCNGTGEARSKLFPWSYHRCQGCNGTGRQIRLGARYIGPSHIQNEYQAAKATQQQRRQQHNWR